MTVLAQLSDLTVVYGRGHAAVHALRDVDLQLRAEESASLWGRSGSGKTTLLHVLGGLVEPTSGWVSWHGEPLSTLDVAARARLRRHAIAYVFQGANLLPHFTAFENVAFAAQLAGDPALAPEPLLELVGLAAKAEHLPAELSGGEAQRVAIAAAAAREAPLVLADEPTAELDRRNEDIVLQALQRLRDEFDSTVVVVTHSSRVAAGVDRVVEIRDGATA